VAGRPRRLLHDIAPADLEETLNRLGREGYSISKSDVREAGDKFYLLLNDNDLNVSGEYEEEESEEK
jgi:hypothetical protein